MSCKSNVFTVPHRQIVNDEKYDSFLRVQTKQRDNGPCHVKVLCSNKFKGKKKSNSLESGVYYNAKCDNKTIITKTYISYKKNI